MADFGPRAAPRPRSGTIEEVVQYFVDAGWRFICIRCGEVPRSEVAITAQGADHAGHRRDRPDRHGVCSARVRAPEEGE